MQWTTPVSDLKYAKYGFRQISDIFYPQIALNFVFFPTLKHIFSLIKHICMMKFYADMGRLTMSQKITHSKCVLHDVTRQWSHSIWLGLKLTKSENKVKILSFFKPGNLFITWFSIAFFPNHVLLPISRSILVLVLALQFTIKLFSRLSRSYPRTMGRRTEKPTVWLYFFGLYYYLDLNI